MINNRFMGTIRSTKTNIEKEKKKNYIYNNKKNKKLYIEYFILKMSSYASETCTFTCVKRRFLHCYHHK